MFENEQELGFKMSNVVFIGEEDDPKRLITISRLSFGRASDICRIMGKRRLRCYMAMQLAQTRERLTEFTSPF